MKAWHLITVHDQLYGGGNLVWWKKWDDLPPELSVRWKWYFVYRAALMQVKYPKYRVEHRWGTEPAIPKEISWKTGMKNRIKGIKGNLTEKKNKLKRAREEWDELFPIEQDPNYPKVINKIKKLERDLQEAIDEYTNATGETP